MCQIHSLYVKRNAHQYTHMHTFYTPHLKQQQKKKKYSHSTAWLTTALYYTTLLNSIQEQSYSQSMWKITNEKQQ